VEFIARGRANDKKTEQKCSIAKFILACAYGLGYKRWDNRNKGFSRAGAMFSGIPDVLLRSE